MVLFLYDYYTSREEKDMEFKLAKKCDAQKVYALVQETIKAVYPKYYLKEIVDSAIRIRKRQSSV